MTDDLAQIHDEMSAFAERFALAAGRGDRPVRDRPRPTVPSARPSRSCVALSTEYGAAADDRDGERFAGLFVADGELVVPNYPEDLRPVITRSGHDSLRRVPDGLRRLRPDIPPDVRPPVRAVDGDDRPPGTVLCVAHHVVPLASGAAGEPDGRDRHGLVHPLPRHLPVAPTRGGGSPDASSTSSGSRSAHRRPRHPPPMDVPCRLTLQAAGTGWGGGGPA